MVNGSSNGIDSAVEAEGAVAVAAVRATTPDDVTSPSGVPLAAVAATADFATTAADLLD